MQDTLQANERTDRFLFLRTYNVGKTLDRYFTGITQLLQESFLLLFFHLISDKKSATWILLTNWRLKELLLMKGWKREVSLVKETTKCRDSQTVDSILILPLHQCIELLEREEQNGRYSNLQSILAASFTTYTCSVV